MSLTQFLKATGNEYATTADEAEDIAGFIDTGSYALNALISGSIYGGLPSNKITGIGALPSTGKTFFVLSSLKHFLDQNPTGLAMIFESESAITKQMLVDRGIDVKRVGVVPVVTVQDFRTAALKVLDIYEQTDESKRQPMFFILDSLGMLSTAKEMADSSAGSDTRDMTRAALLKATFRTLTLRLGRCNVPLAVTNHVYDDVGGGPYATTIQGGGKGLVYSASTILTLSKARDKDTSTNKVTGVIITVTADKSRLTRERTQIKCLIRFDGGLDRHYWLLEIAEAAGIFKKSSTRYLVPDGTTVFGKTIRENPEKYFTPDILAQIEEWVQANFKYTAGAGPLELDAPNEGEVDE